jgi:hypothetical protein
MTKKSAGEEPSVPPVVEEKQALNEGSEEIEVLFFEDDPNWTPEWDAALYEMRGFERREPGWEWTGKYGLASLANALRGDTAVPNGVRDLLAEMLDPRSRWRGPKLKVQSPKKHDIRDAMLQFAKKRNIRLDYEDFIKKHGRGSSEAAVLELEEKYNVRSTYILDAVRTTDLDLIAEFEAVAGYGSSRDE